MACFFVCGANNIKPIKIDNGAIQSGVVISPTVINHIEHCAHCIKKYKSNMTNSGINTLQQIENGLYLSTHLEYSPNPSNISMHNILTNLSISPKTPTIDPESRLDSKQIIKYSPSKSGIYTTHSPNTSLLVEISHDVHQIDYFSPSKSKKKRINDSYPIVTPNIDTEENENICIDHYIPYHIPIIRDVDDNECDLEGIDDDDPIHLYAPNAPPMSPIFADIKIPAQLVIHKNNNKESKYKPPPTHKFNRFEIEDRKHSKHKSMDYDYNIYSQHSTSYGDDEKNIEKKPISNYNFKVIETTNTPSNSPKFYPKVIVEDEEHNITMAEFKKLKKKHQKRNNKIIKKLEKIKEIEYDREYERKSKKKHRKIKSAKMYNYTDKEQHVTTKKKSKSKSKSKQKRIHHVHEHHHHHHHHQINVDKLHKKKKKHKHLNEHKKTTKRAGGDSNGFFTEKYKTKYDEYFNQTKQYEIDNIKTRKGLKLKRVQTSPIIGHYDHKYDYDFDEGIDYKTRNKLRMNKNIKRKSKSKDIDDLLLELSWNKKPELRSHSYSYHSHQSTNT